MKEAVIIKKERKGVGGRSFGNFREGGFGESSAIIDTAVWL